VGGVVAAERVARRRLATVRRKRPLGIAEPDFDVVGLKLHRLGTDRDAAAGPQRRAHGCVCKEGGQRGSVLLHRGAGLQTHAGVDQAVVREGEQRPIGVRLPDGPALSLVAVEQFVCRLTAQDRR